MLSGQRYILQSCTSNLPTVNLLKEPPNGLNIPVSLVKIGKTIVYSFNEHEITIKQEFTKSFYHSVLCSQPVFYLKLQQLIAGDSVASCRQDQVGDLPLLFHLRSFFFNCRQKF